MDSTLDVTPRSSFNTVQFQEEYLNVIVTSILVTLILGNIGSIVSKLVLRSPLASLPFDSFRRFIIFEITDDPLRLTHWLRGKYKYYKKHWKRNRQIISLKYLFLPLNARFALIIASIASIAITIPTQQILSGCENGDFQPVLDTSRRRVQRDRRVQRNIDGCQNFALTSRLGTAKSSLEMCSFVTSSGTDFNSTSVIARVFYLEEGILRWELESQRKLAGFQMLFLWTQASGRAFNTFIDRSVSPEQFLNAVSEGLAVSGQNCMRGDIVSMEAEEGVIEGAFEVLNGCELGVLDAAIRVHIFLSLSLFMERVPERQTRYELSSGQRSTVCPIDVVVQQPLVNILPLTVLLGATFVLNMMFSVITARYGSIVESYFHVVKEIFGHDCMSNPLEESLAKAGDGEELALKSVVREGGGHVGFLEQAGDTVVYDFDQNTVVS